MESRYNSEQNFINRELSWLEFNERVLGEAEDNSNPLLERLKFLSITSSNLDEFFMVRVGSLWDQVLAGFTKRDPAGLTSEEQLGRISARTHIMMDDIYSCYTRSIRHALKKENIIILKEKHLTDKHKTYLQDYYIKNIYPVLTPMVVDQSRPFPLVLNKSLNIALLLQDREGNDKKYFATIQAPSVLERLVEIPSDDNDKLFVLLEDIIKMNLDSLFSGHKVLTSACYRITRNADLTLDEEEAEDLLETIEQSIRQRRWGEVIRFEIEKGMDKSLLEILEDELEVSKNQIYEISGPLDLTFLMKLSGLKDYDHLRYKPIAPQPIPALLEEESIFRAISKGDILLHHPYQSFDPVINLVKEAAADPNVLAIKQTLYRVSGNSPIVESLAEAAENGKQVTVLLELKARFDEQNNIQWAKRLEKSGCHVIYGLIGLKTHCKILLIVRREENGIKRYVHMGTGNYNDVTAGIYTDLGLFTANPYFGADASALFNMLSGHSEPRSMYKTTMAPIDLRDKFLSMINREAENARGGIESRIIAKLNSLVDKEIIEALYDASCSGVNIDLIIRGICCLRPGIPGVSERISVRSIVGRYLEHSRIYYFYNDGEEDTFLSSADLMGRNLDRRVELLFPVEDDELKDKVKEILHICLMDNVKSRYLKPDGTYDRVSKKGKVPANSHEIFYNLAVKEVKNAKRDAKDIQFRPVVSYK